MGGGVRRKRGPQPFSSESRHLNGRLLMRRRVAVRLAVWRRRSDPREVSLKSLPGSFLDARIRGRAARSGGGQVVAPPSHLFEEARLQYGSLGPARAHNGRASLTRHRRAGLRSSTRALRRFADAAWSAPRASAPKTGAAPRPANIDVCLAKSLPERSRQLRFDQCARSKSSCPPGAMAGRFEPAESRPARHTA
jgi:hypothetical protein